MASRLSTEPQSRAEIGQILIVIHDFSARSSDELSLLKGDRVELIERDDDFGDGWFLGRHLVNGNSGLFPAIYTRIAPRGPPSYPPISANLPRTYPVPLDLSKEQIIKSPPVASIPEDSPVTIEPSTPDPTIDTDPTPQPSRHTSEILSASVVTSPLNTSNILPPASAPASEEPDQVLPLPTISTTAPMGQSKSVISTAKAHARGQDSPVMNETLSVIDEHITDMHSPHHSAVVADRRGTNDSGSEYSSHLDQRLSYINGEETDEEEEALQTRDEVNTWSPDQVAEYLFTVGVESRHCEVFRDQEITGEVLLGMDQTSVFLKEFDLGSVGRRLKTWQKIKSLQDEVNGEISNRRKTATYGSEGGSDDAGRHRSMSSSAMLPRIPSMMDRPGSRQHSRLSQQHVSLSSRNEPSQSFSPISPKNAQDGAKATGDTRRPSAASIRDMQHSRQSSANEFTTGSITRAVAGSTSPSASESAHKKQPSFDRNWTMGAAASPSIPTRPLSSSGVNAPAASSTDHLSPDTTPQKAFDALDRGYFSGGEAEGRSRNVLRKRGSTNAHSRNSSYTEEQRLRSATATTRHSRFGSVDSVREAAPPSAVQKYYGLAINGRRRSPSENSVNAPPRPNPPPKDIAFPAVTKLEGNTPTPKSPSARRGRAADWLLPTKPTSSRRFGLRAISDAVTGHEKARVASHTEPLPSVKDSPLQSPSRTGSSTPSAGPSFELDSPDAKTASTMTTPGSGRASNRKKTKKDTSAYTRGLEKKTPQEQMLGADFSGWMKKKSTNLMTTWKPRLFILKGRRLSYYYSEHDTEEKGLIDISFHRVLPADNDRLTGLHATLTGVTNTPTSPPGAQTPTAAATEAAGDSQSPLKKGDSDSIYIFKLVPPRAGLSRAVTFTKPTVHYFAVPNIEIGRAWMGALMKATIDRDDSKAIITTYQQKTISLQKAQAMRHRPPALMNLDEQIDEEALKTPASDKNGLNIQGIIFDRDPQEGDSGVSGVSKNNGLNSEGANGNGTGTFLEIHGGNSNDNGPRTA